MRPYRPTKNAGRVPSPQPPHNSQPPGAAEGPSSKGPAGDESSAEARQKPGLRSRILIVDDEPLFCTSVKGMLAVDGHQVEATHSAEAALELLGRRKFDLFLLDYELPLGTGDRLAAKLKRRFPGVPIVLLTGFAAELESKGIPLSGVDLIISKPFDFEELRQAVMRLLGGS